MSKGHFIVFLGLFWVSLTYGQFRQSSFHPSKSLEECTLDHWTGETGLNSNNLTSIIQDQLGYLWITTYNGLLRFDGRDFELYNRENVDFLLTDSFHQGYNDGQGGLYFSTQGSGIVHYKDGVFRPINLDNPQLPRSIRVLYLGENGEIWAGSNNQGLYLLMDQQIVKVDHPAVKDVSIMAIARGSDGTIWVATNGHGLVRLKNGQVDRVFTTQDGLLSNIVHSVKSGADGSVLVGTTKGLGIWRNNAFVTPHAHWQVHVNAIHEDDYGTYWIATERGLIRYNPKFKVNEWVGARQGLLGMEISDLLFDKEGSLWLTTSKTGLLRYKETGISTIGAKDGLRNELINIVAEDNRGHVWIGSDGGEIDKRINGVIRPFELQNSLTNYRIRDIVEDENGAIWIGTYNGLLRKDAKGEKLFTTDNGLLPAQDVRRLIAHKEGVLWVATRSGGIIKMVHGRVETVYNKKTALRSNYALCMEQDAMGNMYIGTHGGGLSVIDTRGMVNNFTLTQDDSGLLIFNIHIDEDGQIWIVANVGLFHFDGKSFKPLVMEQVLAGETMFDWIEDRVGNIWLTTNKGIIRLRKDDVKKFVRQQLEVIPAQLFNTDDGMAGKECTAATRGLLLSTGEVMVPTLSGVVVINPKGLHSNDLVPPVHINRLKADDQDLSVYQRLIIPAGTLRYEFRFTSLSLLAPSKNKFKYKLENFDRGWTVSDAKREAIYTNLPPGKYTFRVIASNNDGVWNLEGDALDFEVLPFYYQTAIFYVVLGLLVLLVLFAIYKYRISVVEQRNNELRKLNSELDRFVYSASHDLRSPLASIMGLVTLTRLEKENQDEYLDMIERSVKRLDGFISDIIDYSRNARLEVTPEEIDFDKTIQTVFENIKFLDHQNRIRRHVSITGNGTFLTDRVRLDIILNNIISNAVKYHNYNQEDPTIEVRVWFDHRKATIQVIDNGQGIAEEHQKNIFKMFYRANSDSKGSGLGLYIVSETVEKLGGQLQFESKLGSGSLFTVILPSMKMK